MPKFIVEEKSSYIGVSVRQCLKHLCRGLSYEIMQQWLRKKRLAVKGVDNTKKLMELDYALQAGDTIHYPTWKEDQLPTMATWMLNKLKEAIVFEDDKLLVINKPYDMASQGGQGVKISVDVLARQYDHQSPIRLLHRLDRHTCGILMLSKDIVLHNKITQAFMDVESDEDNSQDNEVNAGNKIIKVYQAIVVGILPEIEGTIVNKIAKVKNDQKKEKMEVTATGQQAVTHYKVLKTTIHNEQEYSLVELRPLTGRTHQLRVHMNALGNPILGDGKYGAQKAQPFPRKLKLHLFCKSINISAVAPEYKQDFRCSTPDHMQRTKGMFKSNFKSDVKKSDDKSDIKKDDKKDDKSDIKKDVKKSDGRRDVKKSDGRRDVKKSYGRSDVKKS